MFLGLCQMNPQDPGLFQSKKRIKCEPASADDDNDEYESSNCVFDGNNFINNDENESNDHHTFTLDENEIEMKPPPSSFVYFTEQLVATNRVHRVRIENREDMLFRDDNSHKDSSVQQNNVNQSFRTS